MGKPIDDEELEALRIIVEQMLRIKTAEARDRMLRYLAHRFGNARC